MNMTTMKPEEVIVNKIFVIRGKKVMIDRDLADLYGVETRVLNQAVRRNLTRFPGDFMFILSPKEMESWKSQIVISNRERMGIRKAPFAFTEQGVAMLSSILNSDRAIMVNIQIIRVFTKMREMIEANNDLKKRMDDLERNDMDQDRRIIIVFEYLKQLEEKREIDQNIQQRKRIGFKQQSENT
jgi:hypothetical protein